MLLSASRARLTTLPQIGAFSFLGAHTVGDTPDPIPNSEVKPSCADGTAGVTLWESRSLPDLRAPGSARSPGPSFFGSRNIRPSGSVPGPVARLTKSRSDRMLSGVCGGLADYFDVDPTWMRVAFVVATLLGGPGVVAYVIGWLLMPQPKALYEPRYRALSR